MQDNGTFFLTGNGIGLEIALINAGTTLMALIIKLKNMEMDLSQP